MVKIVSFFTKNTPYEEEVVFLIESCKKFGLDYEIDGIDSLGSWEKNCSYKATFIRDKLKRLKKPIFWVDADATFVAKPTLLNNLNCDLAVWVDPNLDNSHPSKVISAAIYLDYTKATLALVDEWIDECEKHRGEVWDQICLRNVLFRSNAQITPLPQEYCMIYDKIEKHHKPVILQYQASRLYKKVVNNEVAPFWNQEELIQVRKEFHKNLQ